MWCLRRSRSAPHTPDALTPLRPPLCRLHATGNLLRAGRPLPTHASGGGFNEQALSNVVFAFDKAGLLRKELLEHVFMVAALRLMQTDGSSQLVFKPQVRCVIWCCRGHVRASPDTFEPWGPHKGMLPRQA